MWVVTKKTCPFLPYRIRVSTWMRMMNKGGKKTTMITSQPQKTATHHQKLMDTMTVTTTNIIPKLVRRQIQAQVPIRRFQAPHHHHGWEQMEGIQTQTTKTMKLLRGYLNN